jgi:sugar phosphate isomerase/epimerase
MNRRDFLLSCAASPAALRAVAPSAPRAKFGVDLFSIRSSGWSPFEYLDYCARWKADVVHFSEVRFLGGLEEAHVKKVGARARELGIELEIGTRSICPSSQSFNPEDGTAEEQLARMIQAARWAGSKIVRAFLGTARDRTGDVPLEKHIENAAKVLRAVRMRAQDAGVGIAIENQAGDLQARELETLIVEAGKDVVGACIDSGNPLWTLEDPHLTLEVLAPYALTSHVRDSKVWRTPKGAAVRWVRTGEGNVDIESWIRKFVKLCPGKAVTQEVIVTGPREYPFLEPGFWEAYSDVNAAEFARFLALAEAGEPETGYEGPSKEERPQREREDLEASMRFVQQVLGG